MTPEQKMQKFLSCRMLIENAKKNVKVCKCERSENAKIIKRMPRNAITNVLRMLKKCKLNAKKMKIKCVQRKCK